MRIKHGVGALVGAVLLVLTFLFLLPAQNYRETELEFEYAGTKISGQLILPHNTQTKAIDCVVFVHGDGEMNSDGIGYFDSYFSHFAQKDMCSFSWTKPGVEGQPGNWLDYSMADRAALVEKGIAALRANQEQPIARVGLIGFSQAGWVMPKVDPVENDLAFYVFVSPAVNWMRQSSFMSDLRRGDAPVDPVVQQRDLAIDDLLLAGAPYADFEKLAAKDEELSTDSFSKARWVFAVKNVYSDLSADLKKLRHTPVLLLTGARDGQVDADETVETFKEILADRLVTHQFSTAGHSMVEVGERRPMEGFDGLWLLAKVAFSGRDAFVDGYWAAMDGFIAATLE